ncbi:hypothetical protein ES703_52714 [subsurface metagenome]
MTSHVNQSGVELFRIEKEEGQQMPLRKCPYCKGLSNFDLGSLVQGGDIRGTNYVSLDICQNCGTPVYFEVAHPNRRYNVIDSYPKAEVNVDEELPEDVKLAFGQAIRAFDEGIWDGCVVMCRRALEEAVTGLGAEGRDLFNKIDDLESKRRITPELKAWAHETRLGGKLGAHGTKQKKWAEKDDAEEVLEFCRWFFRYIYVLPKQLEERKARLAPPSTEPSG